MICNSKSNERIMESRRKLRRKGKKSYGEGCMLQSLISLSDVIEFLSFYDDHVPKNLLLISCSIESFILALFNSIFGQKKNPSNQVYKLELNLSRCKILYFHIWYSNGNILSFWYWNQDIQKPKFIYTSRTTTFMKDLKWDKIVLENRN